ncbi:RNA 2',3'-cyclic phosphodiesterase [bacterium]|nr:RNA 2',3'-cyclic phosphodiesterase [bacterium]
MRLFTAFEISTAANAELRRVQASLRQVLTGGRLTAPENFHVTLHFFGEVTSEQLGDLDRVLTSALVGEPPFELALDSLGVFPKHGPARVLWAGLAGDVERLRVLEERMRAALQPLELLRPDGRYSPHITLARDPRAHESVRQLAAGYQVRQVAWRVERLLLFQSVLKPTGATYQVLNAYSLK